MTEESEKSALDYHRFPKPGKIEITATKPLANQRDLALAYSPGVAEPCKAISSESKLAAELTSRANLVAVVTNGTAVLGLGDIGPLAAKPVMEGKGVLFKKFAGIDVFDIEINEKDPNKLIDIIASLEPTFGGINLEDIRSPECFQIEAELRKRKVGAVERLLWRQQVQRWMDQRNFQAQAAMAAVCQNSQKLVCFYTSSFLCLQRVSC